MDKSRLEAFYAIAKIAAVNNFHAASARWSGNTWNQSAQRLPFASNEPTFKCPNFTHKRSYFAFLKFIAQDRGNNASGVTRKELCKHFNIKSVSLTTDRLRNAGLISLDTKYTHRFTVTPFGRAYLALAEFAKPELEILAQAKELQSLND